MGDLVPGRKLWNNTHMHRFTFKTPAELWLAGTTVVVATFGILARVINLSFPAKQVFDEVYFPVFAAKYLTGTPFYDVHPPLGKFFIAVGIWAVGDTPLGWRIVPALVGIAFVALMGLLVWRLTRNSVAVALTILFVAIDGAFVVYSRVGLMDGILMAAIFHAILISTFPPRKGQWFWLALSLAIAAAIKWPAAAVALPMYWYCRRQKTEMEFLRSLPVAVVLYFLIVVAGFAITTEANPFTEAWSWHQSAFNYHATITATHPWGSAWWSWPFLQRPVLFLYDRLPDGSIQLMNSIGNPALWWLSTLAVIASVGEVIRALWGRWRLFWEHPLVPMLLGYFAMWLPWILVDRVVFLYHYLPAYGFALLMLVYWLSWAWQRGWRFLIWLTLIGILLTGFLYFRWSLGWWQTPTNHPILLKSWLSSQ